MNDLNHGLHSQTEAAHYVMPVVYYNICTLRTYVAASLRTSHNINLLTLCFLLLLSTNCIDHRHEQKSSHFHFTVTAKETTIIGRVSLATTSRWVQKALVYLVKNLLPSEPGTKSHKVPARAYIGYVCG